MNLTLEDLIELYEGLVFRREDGHLTIMRFTTGWKVMPGTPDLDTGAGRDQIMILTSHKTLEAALVAGIKSYTQHIKTLPDQNEAKRIMNRLTV
jgi:hypothetical protein